VLALGAVIWLLLNDGYANLVGMSRPIAQGAHRRTDAAAGA